MPFVGFMGCVCFYFLYHVHDHNLKPKNCLRVLRIKSPDMFFLAPEFPCIHRILLTSVFRVCLRSISRSGPGFHFLALLCFSQFS